MSEAEPIVFKHNLPEDKARQLVEALREIHDPEIPINVYDLGLIREVNMRDDGSVKVVMTLTAVGCPVSTNIAQEVGLVVQHPARRPRRPLSESRHTGRRRGQTASGRFGGRFR